jgi:alanine dehydrogenase
MRYYATPRKGLAIPAVNQVIEAIFGEHARGNVQMPPKLYVTLPTGDFRTMPAYIPNLGIAGVKIVNVHPQNRDYHLPTVMATTVILDVETGLPQAVINATALTDLRTGGAGGVAAKYLSPAKEIVLGVIGAGRQADAQIAAIAAELTVREVRIWNRNPANAERLAGKWASLNAASVSIEKACDCDVLVTTTPSRAPLVKDAWIHEGTHINAIGADAPGKQEIDPAILQRASVYVDDREQAVHSGEVNVPIKNGLFSVDQIAGTLGEVVIGQKGRKSTNEITLFDSTGLAIQDLAIAHLAMQSAEGIELPFPVSS